MIKNLTILALNDDDTEYKVAEKWWERIDTKWFENDDDFVVEFAKTHIIGAMVDVINEYNLVNGYAKENELDEIIDDVVEMIKSEDFAKIKFIDVPRYKMMFELKNEVK